MPGGGITQTQLLRSIWHGSPAMFGFEVYFFTLAQIHDLTYSPLKTTYETKKNKQTRLGNTENTCIS